MKRPAIIGLIIVICAASLSADASWAQRLVPIDDPVYDYLEGYYRALGTVMPDSVRPMSHARILSLLDPPGTRPATPAAAPYRAAIIERLSAAESARFVLSESEFRARLTPTVSVGLYLQEVPVDGKPALDRDTRPVFFSMPLEFAFGRFLYARGDVDLAQDLNAINRAPNNPTNLPSEIMMLDVGFPSRAYISFGSTNLGASFGRDRHAWGPSETGGLTLSGNHSYLDALRLTASYSRFSYTSLTAFLEPWAEDDQLPTSWRYVPPYSDFSVQHRYRLWEKTLYLHRFTIRPWDFLRFSFTEGAIIGGYPADIRYLNPLMVFHSFFDFRRNTSMAELEIEVAPFRGVGLWGSFYFNDLLLPQEAAAGATEPNAVAYQVGAEYERALTRSPSAHFVARVGGEFYYGDPYVYVRESILRSFINRDRVHTNYRYDPDNEEEPWKQQLGQTAWVDTFLGSPFGNDSVAVTAWLGLAAPGLFESKLTYTNHRDGERGPTDILPRDGFFEGPGPSGVVETTNMIELTVTTYPSRFRVFLGERTSTVGVIARIIRRDNPGHEEGEPDFRAGLGIVLTVGW
ncbi:MAG: hypothetical protein EA426_12235 [Spirochaetaceae bacterium]|nr:MAG: hypothetical protein EA426_12235 [Spirochaetaceae bacterium]